MTRVPSSDAIDATLEKVLSSKVFERSPVLRRLLVHIVRHSQTGDEDSLTEYALGVKVFDRNVGFDPLCDSIVRVQVWNLRKRLQTYYRVEGATDLITIDIPKGGYRAAFVLHDEPFVPILDDPERVCGQVEWSVLRGTAKEIGRIRRLTQQAIRRWPERADLHVALGSTALAALELECIAPVEGVGLLRHAAKVAIRLDASRDDARFHAAIPDIRRSDKSLTLAAASRALKFAPKSPFAHFSMGSTMVSACQLGDGLVHLEQAARLQPYEMFFQTWVAVVLFCTGRPDSGLRHLRHILAFEPRNYLANYWLSLLAAHAARYDEAREAAKRAFQISGSAQALIRLGFVEARSGSVEAADAVLESLVELGKSQYVARSGFCEIYLALGRLDEAAREWVRARAEGDWELGWARPDPRWAPLRGKVSGL
jgi:tetratricopeptide (TPR) repeat protein